MTVLDYLKPRLFDPLGILLANQWSDRPALIWARWMIS
jgi:hypothetical protein